MTSRERVKAALRHQPTDRVPIDFGGHRSSGIAAIAYAKLKKELGITAGDIYVYDVVQQLAIVELAVLDAIGGDTVELGRGFLRDDSSWKEWVLPDGTPCKIPVYVHIERRGAEAYVISADGVDLAVQKTGCLYFEQIHWPWLEDNPAAQDFADLDDALGHTMWTAVPTPGSHIPLTPDGARQLAAGARWLRQSTDRAIVGLFGGSVFEVPQFLYRMDNYLMHMALYPSDCARLLDVLTARYLAQLDVWIKAVGPYIDVIVFGDDLGGQNGPLISPEMYRELVKPWHARLWRRVKELAPHLYVNLHSCGGIEPLLNDLIDAGLDSVNPVQISCKGMDAGTLKTRYGDRLALWGGGCDTREVLPHSTPKEVRSHVLSQTATLAPGGGLVFQQVHNIQADVPPCNVIAMFAAAQEWHRS